MSGTITIDLAGYDFDEMIERALGRAIQERLSELDGEIHDRLKQAVDARFRELTDEALRAECAKILTEGWRKTDSYGSPTGETLTLSSRVRDYIAKGDGYNNPVQDAHKKAVDEALKGEMGGLIKEATEKLRGMLDKTIADKLRAVLSDAVKP